jgi:hypothetical protein
MDVVEIPVGEKVPLFRRENEIAGLWEILDKADHLLVTGRRGTGKTTLLKQFLAENGLRDQWKTFYADLSGTINPDTFITTLAAQTLNVPEAGQIRQLRELTNYFTYLRPSVNYNRISGKQQIDFSLAENYKLQFTLEQLFSYLQRQGKNVLIILDGINQLMDYRDQGFMRLIGEAIRQAGPVKVIYAGDDSFRFQTWLNFVRKDFAGEISEFNTEEIPHESFTLYLREIFAANNKTLTEGVADVILDWSRHHTSTVYTVVNSLLSSSVKKPDEWFLESVFHELLKLRKEIFYTYRRLLTANQWMLLRGIAMEKGAKQVMGGEFVRRYGLGSASSVQTALDALYDKEMVYESEGRLYLEDVLLSRWFESAI